MSTSEKNTADQARHHKRGAHRAWVVIVLVILIAAAAVYFMMRPKTQTAPLPVVEVEKVDVSDVNIYGEYVGRIRAQQFVEVHARVEGYLQKMCFTEGTYVKAGQTLFVIDPQLYQAHVNKARAQLNKAEALARKTKHDLDRIRPLYEQNEVTVSRAGLTQADLTLGYTRVTSPISGYISESYADIGTLVGPSGGKSLLATVVKSDTVRVDFSMTAIDYLRGKDRNVSIGSDNSGSKLKSFVTITLADGSEYPVRGQVDFADPKVDPKTGTFSVRAEMPNPDRNLLPGEFTKVRVLLDVREEAIEVPTRSLVMEKNGAYIYVVRPDSVAEKRFIEIGPEVGNNTIVERGLAKGESIVVEGFHKLTHNMKVAPVVAKPKASTDDTRKED